MDQWDWSDMEDNLTSQLPTIITALIAIYGAILSTYNLVLKRREKSHQVSVNLSSGFLTCGERLSPYVLFIVASNPGHRTVTLDSVGIRLPDKRQIVFPFSGRFGSDVQFPHDLTEGQSCRAWVDVKELTALLEEGISGRIKLIGFYTDAIGGKYKSKPLKFNIDDWR